MNRLLLVGTIAAMGMVRLPAMAFAQSPGPTPVLEQAPPDHPATPALTRPDPQQHLGTAQQLLDAVSAKSLDENAQKKLSKLREDFTHLVTTYQTSRTAATSAGSGAMATRSASKDVVDWKMKFDEVERDLTSVLGGGASRSVSVSTAIGTTGIVATAAQPTGADSSATQPAGSSGPGSVNVNGAVGSTGPLATGREEVAVLEVGVKNLDPGVRTQLEQVRRDIELFYDATTGMGHHP